MKRTSRLLIAAAAAALTFGSLVAIEGPKDWSYHHRHYGWHHHDCDHHDHREADQSDSGDKL